MPEGKLEHGDVSELAAKIRAALGVGTYEEVNIVTPQFEREDGKKITVIPPKKASFFDQIKKAPKSLLKDMGLRPWDESGLWLFPHEWYEHIPEGYMVTDINGQEEPFRRGHTDDDIRFGVLAFGVVIDQ